MCTFCEKIYPNKDCHDIVFALGGYSELKYDPMDRFITIDENGEYDLNVIPDDPYELAFFPDVKFCPYCGRNLAENAEQKLTDECQNRDFNIECQNHNAMLHKAQENVIEKFKSCADMFSDEELKGAETVMNWIQEAEQEPCDDVVSRQAVLTIASLHTLTIDESVEAIKRLPSVRPQEPKWIPVSERLPERTGMYLTSFGDLVTSKSFDGHYFRTESSEVRFVPDAWMPLPHPYEPQESEDK